MKRLIALFTLCFLVVSSFAFSETELRNYNNSRFNYSFIYPAKWELRELDLIYRHIVTISLDNYTEIKVSASGTDDEEKDKWNSIEEWYTRGKGSKMRLILEKKKFKLNENTVSRLLVFQYWTGGRKMLKRMTITNSGNSIIVMECSAPIKTFYRYDRMFNAILRSIKINP